MDAQQENGGSNVRAAASCSGDLVANRNVNSLDRRVPVPVTDENAPHKSRKVQWLTPTGRGPRSAVTHVTMPVRIWRRYCAARELQRLGTGRRGAIYRAESSVARYTPYRDHVNLCGFAVRYQFVRDDATPRQSQ